MPTEPHSPPVTSRTSVLEPRGDRGDAVDRQVVERPAAARSTNASSSDSGSTSGDSSRSSAITRAAGLAVGVEAAGEVRRVRAAGPGLAGGHRRAHPEDPRLVGRGGHHAAAADPADHDRLAAQRRLVALLHGGEERVQVDVEDRRVGAHAAHCRPRRRPGTARLPVHSRAGRPVVHSAAGTALPAGSPRGEASGHDRHAAPSAPRGPADLLALVPGLLGFHPEDSVVLLTVGDARQPFHARVDLPDDPRGRRGAGRLPRRGRRPARRRPGSRSCVYTDDAGAGRGARRRARRTGSRRAGVELVCAIRADGRALVALRRRRRRARARRTTSRCHPLMAQAVLDGTVVLAQPPASWPTRLVGDDPPSRRARSGLADEVAGRLVRARRRPARRRRATWSVEGRWVRRRVRGHLDGRRAGSTPTTSPGCSRCSRSRSRCATSPGPR